MAFNPVRYRRPKRKAHPDDELEFKRFCFWAQAEGLSSAWMARNPRPRCPTMIAHGNNKPQMHEEDIARVIADYNTFHSFEEDVVSNTTEHENIDLKPQPDDQPPAAE